jgi:uncharacterized membrane protein YedE/YeeE
MLTKTIAVIWTASRILAGLWLAFMGLIASFMLYNEIFDPEWGRQSKERFPDAPQWYILALVAVAAMVCFYIAFRLAWPRKSRKDTNSSANAGDGQA